MKKCILLTLILFFAIPVFADVFINENAKDASIYHLKKLIRENNLKEQLRFLEFDNEKISEIILLGQENEENIKTIEIKNFGASCKNRNKIMLRNFKYKYFIPSYRVYKSIDEETNLTLDDWIENIGLAKTSPIHKYYVNISENYEDCDRILQMFK